MTTNKKIESLDDFKGQKIRTMENKYHLAFLQSIGANLTPMTLVCSKERLMLKKILMKSLYLGKSMRNRIMW